MRWQPGGDVAKEDAIVMAGTFVESLANTDPKIQIAGGHDVLAHISGNMRKHLIRIVPDCIVPEPHRPGLHRPGPHRPRTASSRAIVSRRNFPVRSDARLRHLPQPVSYL